jgi:hypothetical protein
VVLDRGGRCLHGTTAFIEQSSHASAVHPADKVVANFERSVLDQHRCNWTLAGIELRFHDRSNGRTIRVGLEIQDLGLQQNLVEEIGDPLSRFRRNLHRQHGPAELLENDALAEEILFDLLRVRRRKIDLVYRSDHRDAGILGVRDRFDRLRHHHVVCGDHEDDNVGDLCAARTHRRERLVAGRVEKGDLPVIWQRDVIRADVLRNSARLARNDVGFADVIEK